MTQLHEVTFQPNPVQKAFIESRAIADLFSSRMGEGKSAAIAWACFYHTSRNPGARWAIIRDTWDNLEATTMKEFFKWFPPGVFGNYQSSRKTFTWAVEGMGNGEVQFLGMDDPTDATKLQSRELAGFGIDEPAPAAESGGVAELIFDVALSRLRQPGMKWYSAKLAQNNPDETHWTYRRFVEPGTAGFANWQPMEPENVKNLPDGYYETLRGVWQHRPDLLRRFVEGMYGFQQSGKAVTPEWEDGTHLATGLTAMKGIPLELLWDFGLNPTCAITQVLPLGGWNIIESYVGEGVGVYQLVEDDIKPLLQAHYPKHTWRHIGDPMGKTKEQSNSLHSAVRVIRKELGGIWKSGPVRWHDRIDPLRAVLSKSRTSGRGLIQVDRVKAKAVWHALRGGWHYNITRAGLIGAEPVKDIHSHPGDVMGYGAAVLYPLGRLRTRGKGRHAPQIASHFGPRPGGLGFERPGLKLPSEIRRLGP